MRTDSTASCHQFEHAYGNQRNILMHCTFPHHTDGVTQQQQQRRKKHNKATSEKLRLQTLVFFLQSHIPTTAGRSSQFRRFVPISFSLLCRIVYTQLRQRQSEQNVGNINNTSDKPTQSQLVSRRHSQANPHNRKDQWICFLHLLL